MLPQNLQPRRKALCCCCCRGAAQAWDIYNSMWPIRVGFVLVGGSLPSAEQLPGEP